MKRNIIFALVLVGVLILAGFVHAENQEATSTKKSDRVPDVISAPTIPFPSGKPPSSYGHDLMVHKYEALSLHLNQQYDVCGDRIVDLSEECDDGNRSAGDGCSDLCRLEDLLACGNAQINPGEGCDDGNSRSGDGCSATCQLEMICGDGQVSSGEACDDGNLNSGDGCSAKCSIEDRAEDNPQDEANDTEDEGGSIPDTNAKDSDDSTDEVAKPDENAGGGDPKTKTSGKLPRKTNDDEPYVFKNPDSKEQLEGDYDVGGCVVNPNTRNVEYRPGRASTSISQCQGSCTMKVVKDNCGNITQGPVWLRGDDRISGGTYSGGNGVEIDCATGRISVDGSTQNLELTGGGNASAAIVTGCS